MDKRNTVQRAAVLDAVCELGCHASADEVYEHIAQNYPSISKGTVYRNLKLLSDLGEILRVEIPSGADRYDHQCHKHYHAQCVVCGKVFDVDMDFIEDMEKCVKDTHGFVFMHHDIVFKGICLECNNKNNERTK